MKISNITLSVEEYENLDELELIEQQLVAKALEATEGSYAPYSNFHVGAAVLLENGEIVIGANQENAAFPNGMCAERVALFYAGSKYPGVYIKTVAIAVRSDNPIPPDPIPPCGGCRQSFAEYEYIQDGPIRILMHGNNGKVMAVNSINILLPFSFKANNLKHNH